MFKLKSIQCIVKSQIYDLWFINIADWWKLRVNYTINYYEYCWRMYIKGNIQCIIYEYCWEMELGPGTLNMYGIYPSGLLTSCRHQLDFSLIYGHVLTWYINLSPALPKWHKVHGWLTRAPPAACFSHQVAVIAAQRHEQSAAPLSFRYPSQTTICGAVCLMELYSLISISWYVCTENFDSEQNFTSTTFWWCNCGCGGCNYILNKKKNPHQMNSKISTTHFIS